MVLNLIVVKHFSNLRASARCILLTAARAEVDAVAVVPRLRRWCTLPPARNRLLLPPVPAVGEGALGQKCTTNRLADLLTLHCFSRKTYFHSESFLFL